MRTPTRLAVLPLLVVACGGPSATPPADPPVAVEDLTGSTWLLREGEGPAGSVLTVPDARVTLRFEEGGDQLGGVSGCNHYGGEVTLDGDHVRIGQQSGTDMGCERPLMEVEQRYLETLRAVDTYTVDADVLTLTGTDARLTFDRQPDAPTAALLGTRWRLEAVVEGDGDDAAATPAGDPAELWLDDGTLELVTDCVRVDAEWVEQGAEYRITASRHDYADVDAACLHDDPEQQRILEVFDGAFTAEVDGERLTLRATRSATALQLRPVD